MASAGLGQVFIIVSVFVLLLLVNFLSVGLKKIEEDWELYRCNPLVMPFAGLIGKDPTENFTECIKNMQTDYMSILMQPIDMNFSILGEIAGSITESIANTMSFIDGLRDMISNITVGLFGAFSGVMAGFALTMLAIRDLVSRLMAVVFLTLYAMNTLLFAGQSLWAGSPGKLVRTLCFSPGTLVNMETGPPRPIEECVPGTRLSHGIHVEALMEIDNRDGGGGFVERMYKYDGGLVSGSHLVYNRERDSFEPARQHAEMVLSQDKNFETLYCLITSNHLIPSGNQLFHDWEDNNGSPAKSLTTHCLF